MATETAPPPINNNNVNTNNNINNIHVHVNAEPPKKVPQKKKSFIKSFSGQIVIGVLVALISTIIIAKTNAIFGSEETSKEEQKKKIFTTLIAYSDGINKKKFDAYKYFTPKIERFYQMFNASPKKVNDYVNGLFYQQFQNPTMWFDENTLTVKEINNGEFEASVIMYSTYYKLKEKKQYNDYRTRMELRLDNNFHIKYFRQFLE